MNTLQERLREVASHMTDFPMRMKTDVMREAADRIDELEAENFALAAGQCAEVIGDEGGTPRCKRIDALEAENAALRKDAERYRWLRDGCCDKDTIASYIAAAKYGMEWDAAIDAARSKT